MKLDFKFKIRRVLANVWHIRNGTKVAEVEKHQNQIF